MVFPDPQTPCNVCDKRRTDVFLQRLEKTVHISLDEPKVVSILYCNDNGECKDLAVETLQERIDQLIREAKE